MPITIQPIEHRGGGPLIRPAYDVAAVEHRARLVAAQAHGHPLLQTGVDEPPHRRPPQIVLEQARHPAALRALAHARLKSRIGSPSTGARRRPQAAAPWPPQMREQRRDDAADLELERLHPGHLRRQQDAELVGQVQNAASAPSRAIRST